MFQQLKVMFEQLSLSPYSLHIATVGFEPIITEARQGMICLDK